MPAEGRDFRDVLATKFGGWERAKRMFDRIRELGAEMDLTFDFEAIDVAPNTADAHRLVLWAQDRDGEDVADAVATALFRAYFSEGRNVSDAKVLASCAAEVGLDADDARALLDGDEYTEAVRESQQQAQRRGITGVPCYVFGERHAVTGAQPVEVFVEALDAVRAESTSNV